MSAKKLNHIDWATIETLRELQLPDEPDITLILIDAFFESSDDFIKKILVEDDEKTLLEVTHSWKSSAFSLGAFALGDLLIQLHDHAGASKALKGQLINAIQEEYRQVHAELSNLSQS